MTKEKIISFKIKDHLHLNDFKIILIINAAIGLLFSLAFTFSSDPEIMAKVFVRTVLFTLFIGSTIYIGFLLTKNAALNFDSKNFIIVFLVIISFGWIGALIAWAITLVFFNFNMELLNIGNNLLKVTVLNLIIGSSVYLYLLTRTKHSTTAAKTSKDETPKTNRIQISYGDKIKLLKLEEIYFIKAEDKNIEVCTFDQKYTMNKSLTNIENEIDGDDFVRVHRSAMINLNHVDEFIKWFSGTYKVRMDDKDKTELPVSRGQKSKLGLS